MNKGETITNELIVMPHDCDHARDLSMRVLARTHSVDLDRLLRGYLRAHALDCPFDKRGDFSE